MKILSCLICNLFMLVIAHAQPKGCDNLLQKGDTTVCQDFNGKGKLFREHFYVNGKREFTRWWHFSKKGDYYFYQKKNKSPFAKKHGPEVHYYPDGKIKIYAFYQNGIRTGKCYFYYPSGKMKSACNTNHKGKSDGLFTAFFENGQVMQQTRWKDGRMTEIISNRDEEGNEVYHGTFKDGNGTWIYREPGTSKAWIIHFKDGKSFKTVKAHN